MSWYRIAADAVVLVHATYIAFVVFGLVAIVIGLVMKKSWARHFWFRAIHLVMIGIVVLEASLGLDCPLTTLEKTLRRLAGGQVVSGTGFIEYWVHRAIFFDVPPWVFVTAYTLFGLVVLATFVFFPTPQDRFGCASFFPRRSVAMTPVARRPWIPILFGMIAFNALTSGFFQIYWLKDNRPWVNPVDLGINWLSDADYRTLETTPPAQEVTLTDGRTFVRRAEGLLSLYQMETPDGRWRGLVTTRVASPKLETWLITGVPAFILGALGLAFSLSAAKPERKHRLDPSSLD